MQVNANTQIYDKTVDRAAMIRLYEQRVNDKVSVAVDEHSTRLHEVLKGGSVSSPKGRESLIKDIDHELSKSAQEKYNISKRSLLDLFTDQVSFTYANIESAMGKVWRTERPQRRLAEEVVLDRPLYNDQTLAQGWGGIASRDRVRLEAVIRRGIAEGWTEDQIANEVRRSSHYNITRSQSKGLVVTAITSVAAQADQAVYEANEKAIDGYQYVAILDSRTTAICAARDGKIFPITDRVHRPPAHYYCRSKTVPVFKSWSDISSLEGVAQVRKRNLAGLTKEQVAFYDGQTPLREPYNDWLLRQPQEVQLRHLGDYQKVKLFQTGQVTLDRFTKPDGAAVGIRELRAMTTSEIVPGDTVKFANAKAQLDAMKLGASTPDDFIGDKELTQTLRDYYLLQAGELEGTLSATNYRGLLLGTKRTMRKRVLTSPPTDEQRIFNPVTGRYEDSRMYQPNPSVLANNMRLVDESEVLKPRDKDFIRDFEAGLNNRMSVNERAVVVDNLRIIFTRYRASPDPWVNLKAVIQNQIKFDIMNVSDAIETQLRRDTDVLKKLLQDNYIDPVLGAVQLDELSENFIPNVFEKNSFEDFQLPKVAKKLQGVFDTTILRKAPVVWKRLDKGALDQFYLRFAHRLSLADSPDRDAFAVSLGRDLYNSANLNGSRTQWFELGLEILKTKKASKFFEVETFGVQKRRMKSRLSDNYFGPYYDTLSFNIRVVDPKIQEYARLTRKVDLGLRIAVTSADNQLVVRPGFKTYFVKRGVGYSDTRIPITSTNSFGDFPEEFVDDSLADALNWAGKTQYKIDEDYYDFIRKLLYFEDDRGNARLYNDLNGYRKHIASRGDAYERFKAMDWLRASGKPFSNHPFVDHRARIYDRGLISPQSGETFRPFLNTAAEKNFSVEEFHDFQDQIGSFLGGLSDYFEGRFNGLSITGRQKIAERWRPEIVKIGNHMLRAKPGDIRAILESDLVAEIEGEELGKFYRFAIEMAKIDNHLGGKYDAASLATLRDYKTALALEQDASSSGAQIIALTTRNKQLAEMSNVIPTNQKKRLYDEIASATFQDPRFKKINEKLGLSEKDLRKAAKAQNMVTFYGAGERTGIMNVEGKLAKVLGKETGTLVVKAADRDTVLNEISAQIARYDRFDPDTAQQLRALRQDVKDVFNKGIDPGDDILEQLYFLHPDTRALVEKLSANYDRVVTPDDFKAIASIMSDHLREQVPILKDFTRFFGRLAEDYLANAKPSTADFDWKTIAKVSTIGQDRSKPYVLPKFISKMLDLKPNEPLSEKVLKRFSFWNPQGGLKDLLFGVDDPEHRRTGAKFFKTTIKYPTIDLKNASIGAEKTVTEVEFLYANKLPKSWTNVPWVNFDGKIVEQNFTQSFEERLSYKDKDGNWVNNILQIPQKTEASWWDQAINKSGKMNDIADATKARTAFAVNGNHSNDAVIVKRFHLWGKDNGVPTSTIHDAFFANASDMLKARKALRGIYANALKKNSILMTLNEMRARGLPQDVYERYLEEAIDIGLIPVVGRSKIGGRVLRESDILKEEDILQEVPDGFKSDYGWYGVG